MGWGQGRRDWDKGTGKLLGWGLNVQDRPGSVGIPFELLTYLDESERMHLPGEADL